MQQRVLLCCILIIQEQYGIEFGINIVILVSKINDVDELIEVIELYFFI